MNEALGLGILNSVMILLFIIWNGLFFNGLNDDIAELKDKIDNSESINYNDFKITSQVFDYSNPCKDIYLVPYWYEMVYIIYETETGHRHVECARLIPDTINCKIVYHLDIYGKCVATIYASDIICIELINKKDNNNDTDA